MTRSWLGSMRVRILAVVIFLLLVSAVGSVLVLRAALLADLETDITQSLDRESEEFRLLAAGTDPRTGERFDGNLEAVFDVSFSRELADEGELLLALVGGRVYESLRAQDAAGPGQLPEANDYWLALEAEESGALGTAVGEARYVALPLEGTGGPDGAFVVVNFAAAEQSDDGPGVPADDARGPPR